MIMVESTSYDRIIRKIGTNSVMVTLDKRILREGFQVGDKVDVVIKKGAN
jgi:hypothetical protein